MNEEEREAIIKNTHGEEEGLRRFCGVKGRALTSGLSPDIAELTPEGLLLYLRGHSSPIPLLTPSQGDGLLKPLVLHMARARAWRPDFPGAAGEAP